MFVLSVIAVFLCLKMMGGFFTPENMSASWVDGVAHQQSKDAFKASSQARFLRAQVQARGSHTWGF
jgi:hypothetical protein|tara:strand:+ start:32 stop:229 length:198 start_codon:yes stop_codon:yes gene_type:complete